VLLTGRGSTSQWHTETRTAKSPVLRRLAPRERYAELAPADAERLGITSEDEVVVASARGTVRARAFVTPAVRRGQVFLPMHDAETNRLTHASVDPHSRQPAYKHAAVSVRPLPVRP
jgi:assimilatory nitrate reductase catalytic subunit